MGHKIIRVKKYCLKQTIFFIYLIKLQNKMQTKVEIFVQNHE
jgi:hypothetical protein